MTTISLWSLDQTVLFSGQFDSVQACLEQAKFENIDLSGLNLTEQDLRGANLDGTVFVGTKFCQADLTGANLTESIFIDCDFSRSKVLDCCFSESYFKSCQFHDTVFGATDFFNAELIKCSFNNPECFSIPFYHCKSISECSYKPLDEFEILFSKPPVVISGPCAKIILIGTQFLRNNEIMDCKQDLSHWLEALQTEVEQTL
jgi:hypothetical protein